MNDECVFIRIHPQSQSHQERLGNRGLLHVSLYSLFFLHNELKVQPVHLSNSPPYRDNSNHTLITLTKMSFGL